VAVAEQTTLDKLNALLAYLRERVPFYTTRLPEQPLTRVEQLAEVPFTLKDDFRENYPFGLFAVPLDDVVRLEDAYGREGTSEP
jgi:phenylacetate-CoA ligase